MRGSDLNLQVDCLKISLRVRLCRLRRLRRLRRLCSNLSLHEVRQLCVRQSLQHHREHPHRQQSPLRPSRRDQLIDPAANVYRQTVNGEEEATHENECEHTHIQSSPSSVEKDETRSNLRLNLVRDKQREK